MSGKRGNFFEKVAISGPTEVIGARKFEARRIIPIINMPIVGFIPNLVCFSTTQNPPIIRTTYAIIY